MHMQPSIHWSPCLNADLSSASLASRSGCSAEMVLGPTGWSDGTRIKSRYTLDESHMFYAHLVLTCLCREKVG
jgi:hypothetical protein